MSERDWIPCPTPNRFTGASCKRKGCPSCGGPWARNTSTRAHVNLDHLGRSVVMVSVTAPGADVLPWDDERCSHRRRHRHSGPAGCRVEDKAADEWCATLSWRWTKLLNASRNAVRRELQAKPPNALRAWEPQKRGVPHVHVVLAYGTPAEVELAHCMARALKDRAAAYGFGFVDAKEDPSQPHGVRLKPISAEDAARYLASYLTGRRRKKGSIRENIADPRMPKLTVWINPVLTKATGCTMRNLRYANWYFAALSGRAVILPRLRGDLMLEVAKLVALLERYRGRAPDGETEDGYRIRLRRHVHTLVLMRRLEDDYQIVDGSRRVSFA